TFYQSPSVLKNLAHFNIGIQTSVEAIGSVPVKLDGATPTIEKLLPFTTSCFPTTSGSALKRRLQRVSLITTAGSVMDCSGAVNPGPRCRPTSITEKYFTETTSALIS